MILKLVAISLLCLLAHIIWQRRKYYFLCLKVKGPLGYPILGMAHVLIKSENILQNFKKYERIYGAFLYSWLGPKPIVIVSEPQLVQDILTSPNCVNKGVLYEPIIQGTGGGLFTMNNPEWSVHRKLLNPAFSYKSLMGLMPIFNEEIGKLLSVLNAKCGEGEVDIMNILQLFTLSLSAKTTLGEDLSTEDSYNMKILESYQCLLGTLTRMCFSPWLKIKLVRCLFGIEISFEEVKTNIRHFVTSVIKKKLPMDFSSELQTGNESTFLNLTYQLLRNGSFTYKNVEDENNVIVFGAFETTATTIGYILMLLAMFPSHQQKLFEEIKSFYPDNGDFGVDMVEVQQLVFLDMVVNESMRVMAPVPIVARTVSKDVTLSNGVTLPEGLLIAIDIFNMHRRTDIWGPDAHNFNPENFLPSNLEEKHSYAFIPFTKGMRNCIGWRYGLLSVKMALIKLIRNYEFKTKFNFEDLHFVEAITLKLKKTPLLKLSRRDC